MEARKESNKSLTVKSKLKDISIILVLTAISALFLFPILMVLINSFKGKFYIIGGNLP